MRFALAFLLVLLAVVSAVVAWGPLHNLWADYKDSPDSTYLLFGLPFVAIAVACLAAAVIIVRRS
jgi:purine-cytosine permease-like protein